MKKYELVKSIVKELNIEAWVMYSDEHSDNIFEKYICDNLIVPSIAVVTATDIYLIVNDLDYDNVINLPLNIYKYGSKKSLKQKLSEVLKEILYFPSTISLSYTTRNDAQVDMLGFGIYQYLIPDIIKLYRDHNKTLKIDSAENIIYALFDRKNELTINRMKIAADRALDILEEAFANLKEGMTEHDIVKVVQDIFDKKSKYEKLNDVMLEEYSWAKELCPIALVGPSLEKGGHAMASDQILERGYTVYFDFGVSLTFNDGETVSSDLQRMGYLLKEGEVHPPMEVQKVFDVLIESISIGITSIKPGLKGYEIDELVRNHIIKNGYPDYNHATGHSIGEEAHNPGTLLGQKDRKLSNLNIQKYGTYTIEPRISIFNGGSIEEMVLVTENGGKSISRRQKEIYLIQ